MNYRDTTRGGTRGDLLGRKTNRRLSNMSVYHQSLKSLELLRFFFLVTDNHGPRGTTFKAISLIPFPVIGTRTRFNSKRNVVTLNEERIVGQFIDFDVVCSCGKIIAIRLQPIDS